LVLFLKKNKPLFLAMLMLPATTALASGTKHLFSLNGTNGANPFGPVTIDQAGNVFGTAAYGGDHNAGTLFMIPSGGQLQSLYSFRASPAPNTPIGNLLLDKNGDLYGSALNGGAGGCGAIFRFSAKDKLKILYAFGAGGGNDGCYPVGVGPRVKGVLYGTTKNGGQYGGGTVFQIAADGTETILHAFGNDNDGAAPYAGLTPGPDGTLYGTTAAGGAGQWGTIFKITPGGAYATLYAFTNQADGGFIAGGVVIDKLGSVYGTASEGGVNQNGTIFRVAPDGEETTLYSFHTCSSQAGLIFDANANLYGTCLLGGDDGLGYVFKLAPDGKFTLLARFTPHFPGANPATPLTLDGSGHLWGTTELGGRDGGPNGNGAVFVITP
jgi:uncharacterized repeat protein (TIGR03803 family)